MNVAPPKPTRLLSEPERTAMLKHDTSPGTPETPLNQPVMELGDPPTVHIVCEKQKDLGSVPVDVYMNSNNVGWDTATEELLLSLDKQHLFSFGHNPRLELLDLDAELIQAPLASPEALSAASSISALSRTGSIPKGEQRSENMSAKLATIQQSPEICVRSDDSAENLCENYDGTAAPVSKPKNNINESRSVGDFLKKNQFLQTSDLSAIAHASQGSLNNLLPNIDYANSQEGLNKDTQSIDIPFSQPGDNVLDSDSKQSLIDSNNVEKVKPENEENEKLDNKVVNEEDEVYERHSPTETTQYGYFDPNELYSAASVGYHPQLLVGPAKPLKMSESQNLNSHPANKVLQYSHSESRLKGLSEEYQMKRSTEEGDIAHLQDTSDVFLNDKMLRKNLKARGSEPTFNPNNLPKLYNEGRLSSVEEQENIDSENCDISNKTSEDSRNSDDGIQIGDREFKPSENDHTSADLEDIEENSSDSDNNDKTCLLKGMDSDSEGRTITDTVRPRSENGHRKDNYNMGRVSTLSSPDDGDTRLFHSNSCHSTFASSTSGESEQRLSLISANSEDLPIVETDV